MRKIISFVLVITFIFQFNTISVLAEEINKNLESTIREEAKESSKDELENHSENITEKSTQVDTEGIKINSITANKNSLMPGEELQITVDASDDIGLSSVSGYLYVANEWNYIEFNYDINTGKYIYNLPITEEMEYKKINLSDIIIEDSNGNSTNFNNYNNDYLDIINVTDSNGNIDNENPIFNSITFSKEELKIGDKLEILIDTKDELSGIKKIFANLNIGSDVNYIEFEATETSDIYKYTLDITEDMKYKKISIHYLCISDNAENNIYLYNEEINVFANVIDGNGKVDKSEPILNNIVFSSDKVKVEDTLEIKFDVEDDLSGINCIDVSYNIGDSYYYDNIYANENNEYKLQIKVTEEMLYKKIYFTSINIRDNAGNIKYIEKNELGNYGAIVVDESGQADNEDPKINSITVNKNSLMPGEELQIIVDASDDIGLSSVNGDLYIANEWNHIEFNYDINTGKYIYNLPITEEMKYKKIELNNIQLLDKADNRVDIYNHNNEYLEDINITDENGIIDNEAPIFNSLSFSKEKLKVGDKLDILVNVKDELSGVKNIYSDLIIGNDYKNISFQPTDIQDVYKYTLDITEDMKYKKITINNLNIWDNAGNYTYIGDYEINASAKVTDENGFIDETEPVLNNIIFSSSKVKVGDTLEVTFDVEDNLSEVYSIQYIYNLGDCWNRDIVYKNENNEFKITIEITDDMAYKKLNFSDLIISDIAGNKNNISQSELENYVVNIGDRSGLFDNEDPKINSVIANKNSLMPGEELQITVDASDDIGLSAVSGDLHVANEWKSIEFNYDKNIGKYIYNLPITEDMKYKKIKLNNIELLDKADNRVYIYNHNNEYLEDINITDENGIMDTEGAIFNSLSFSKDVLKVGDKLDILVNVKDELSGISNVSGNLKVGNYYDYINFQATDTPDLYKYTLTITEDMKYSKVIVDNLNINDNAGNYTYVGESEINASAKVVDENGNFDETMPTLNNIELNKNKIKVGEVLEITLDIEDDLSGLDYAYLRYSIGNSVSYGEYINKDENGKFKLSIEITEDMIYKIIKLDYLSISDRAGNELVFEYKDLLKYKVQVTDNKGLMDNSSPKINKFEVSTKNPKVGDIFEVYVDATDDLSGINNIYMDIFIENYSDEFHDYVNLVYDNDAKKYKYSFEILDNMKYKNMRFIIDIYDKAENSNTYDSYSLGIGDITIADANGKIDDYSPIFNSISISKDKVKVGEAIDIIADVVDNESGISSVRVNCSIPGIDHQYIYLEYDSSIKKYKGTLIAKEEALYKAYYINSIEIYDNASNFREKIIDNPYKVFVTDETGKIDIDLPVIKNISIDKNKAKIGDKLKITMEASDVTSGIKKAVYNYYIDYNYNSIELNYNTATQKYEAEITVDESMQGKIIEPSSIEVFDNVGNYIRKDYWEIKDLSVKIMGGESIEDIEGPKFLSVSLDKKIVKVGDKVKVSVNALDNLSGIKWISVYFNNRNLDLEYNKLTKRYEGYIDIYEDEIYKKSTLTYIRLVDNEYNTTDVYDDTFGNISFVVSDFEGKIDNTDPVLTGYSIYKNKFKWNEKPVIKVDFSDDLSGVETIKIKTRNLDGSKVYYSDAYLYEKNKNTVYVVLYEISNLLINERIFVEEITLIDFAGNKVTYTSDKNDFSSLTFDKGNYLEEEKVNIKTNNIHVDDEYITGTTSLGNIGLRIYYRCNGKIQIVQEGVSDSTGNFKIKLDPNYAYENYMIEAYDTKTNEVLGYSDIEVNKSVDVTEDGIVDIEDLAEVALHYGESIDLKGGKSLIIFQKDTKFNSDINNDYYIDIFDLILVSKRIN